MLEVDKAGGVVRDTNGTHGGVLRLMGDLGTAFAPRVRLPNERAGTLLIFKTLSEVSFGLIVGASNTVAGRRRRPQSLIDGAALHVPDQSTSKPLVI